MDKLKLPKYPIPCDLTGVLDSELDVYSWSRRARVFSQVIEFLKNVDYLDLSENHYLLLLKLGLYLEEYKIVCDMNKNTMNNRRIEKGRGKKSRKKLQPKVFSKILKIPIGESMQIRELIKPGDFVDITANCKTYTLKVTEVTQHHVVTSDDEAKFYETFSPQKKFQIAFRFNNYSMRCAHFSLWLMHERNSLTYLFPFKNKSFIKDDGIILNTRDLKIINSALKRNHEQKQAVLNIINRSSFPAPYILYGPPGTGKTTTIIETICQLHRIKSNVLVCTPFSTSADEITKMLLKFIPPKDIYRIYNQYTEGSKIEKQIQKCANCENGVVTLPKYLDVISKRIIIITLSYYMRLLLIGIEASYFSHVIIDDADRATEPDILIPVSLVSEDGKLHSQIVLAGDPQLLGPTVRSNIARPILGRSILERLMSYDIYQMDSDDEYHPKYITKLLRNYRMHPDILHISNKLFHNSELIPKCKKNADKKFPVIFYGVDGLEELSPKHNIYNPVEIGVIVDYVDDLIHNRMGVGEVKTDDIGIITPFAVQRDQIKKTLRSIGKLENIKVGTIDCFQDDERKIMIMSTVKCKTFVENDIEHIGILSDAKLFNLAMTRATEFLIVAGNPIVLQIDNMWRCLIKFCLDNKSYDGVEFSLDDRSMKVEENATRIAALKSSCLFEDNLLKLFRLDEYNPQIDYAQIENLSVTCHSKIVNPVGYWDTYTCNDYAAYFVYDNSFDQTDSTTKDVFENVDYFDIKKFIYMVPLRSSKETESSHLNKIQQKSDESDTLKHLDSFNHANDSRVIKTSMGILNNLMKNQILQTVSNLDNTKLGDSSDYQKTFKKQEDTLTKIDFKNKTHSGQIQLKNLSALKIAYNEQQDLFKDDTLNEESQSPQPNSENFNDSQKSLHRREDLSYEINNSEKVNTSAIKTSQHEQKNLDVAISDNISYIVPTKLENSSDTKERHNKQEGSLCKLNTCITVSHIEHTQFDISNAKMPQDKQKDLLDSLNTKNQSDQVVLLGDTSEFQKSHDKQEDLLCKTNNSEIVPQSTDINSENSIASKTLYDEQEYLLGNDTLDIESHSVCTKTKDSSDLKKLDDLPHETNNSESVIESDCRNEKISILRTSHDNEGTDLLKINILNNVDNSNYMTLADSGEPKKCSDKQKLLLLKAHNSITEPHQFNIESENSSAMKASCGEQKSQLDINDILKIVSMCDYNMAGLSELEKCCTGPKKPLLEANSFKTEPHYAQIDFERSVLEASYHQQKKLLKNDTLNIGSDCNYKSLDWADLGELNKFFDKQELLLHNSKDATHSGNVEFENYYLSKKCCDEKNLMKNNISETVQEAHCSEIVDSGSEAISTNKQENLIDFDCSFNKVSKNV